MKNFKVISSCVLILCLISCGLLQRNSTSNSNEEEFSSASNMSLAETEQVLLEAQSLTFFTDSTSHDYQVQLWPKGPFKYSASTGFEGEAEKVLISGDMKGLKKESASSLLKTKATNDSQFESNISEKDHTERTAVTKKATPAIWFVLGGLVLLAIILLFFLRLKF